MKNNKLPSGMMRAINKRLELMGISLDEYVSEFLNNECSVKDLQLLNRIIESIPESGRLVDIGIDYPVIRADEDESDDYKIETECSVTLYDVTLPVVISILAHPFFWNGGEPSTPKTVELNNMELYSRVDFMNSDSNHVNFREDFELIKDIFSYFQPYMDSKLASRIPEKDLEEFMGEGFAHVTLNKLLSTLSYLGFPLSRSSIVFPSIHYSVGITKNIPAKHCLKGITATESGYTEEFRGGLGDVYHGDKLDPDMEDIYARRDMYYFDGKDD